jgi:hypothetical protein
MKTRKIFGLLGLLVGLLVVQSACADWDLLPESRDQQFRTFGLFIDNQTSALFIPGSDNVWLALGEQIPLVEFKDWFGSPQLIVFASVNAGDRMNDNGTTILMETIDIRAGLLYEFSFDKKSRMSIGWEHQSGHTSDDVQDPSIVHPNLGNELFMVRYVHDVEDKFRLGGELKPYFAADPGMEHFTPFIAASLEQYGPNHIQLTANAELGAYVGNHMNPYYKPSVRFVVGYYNGVDPRLKYAQFENGLQRFGYFGAQVGL